jgi:hypothetical protein
MIREKQSITIEIDPEVLAFLEQRHEHGEGERPNKSSSLLDT